MEKRRGREGIGGLVVGGGGESRRIGGGTGKERGANVAKRQREDERQRPRIMPSADLNIEQVAVS